MLLCVLMILNLQASQGNLVIDYKDWQIPLGRRFRCVFGIFSVETCAFAFYLHIYMFLCGVEISLLLTTRIIVEREFKYLSASSHT